MVDSLNKKYIIYGNVLLNLYCSMHNHASNHTETKLRAAVYIRVSTEEQVEKFWPDLQYTSIENYIKSRSLNLELAGEEYIYRDMSVSWASPIEDRPALSQMFRDLDNGKDWKPFDVVIVYKIDRFARKLSILLDIVDLIGKFGISFISTQESIDTSHPFGKAMLGILWVFAELERDTIQERTYLGREESKKKGVVMQNVYGYIRDPKTKRPIVYKPEADVIQTIFDLFVNARFTPNQIAQKLSQDKILIPACSSKPGQEPRTDITNIYKRWDKTIRTILANDMYIGKLYYEKTKLIIDKETGQKKQVAIPREDWILSEYTHEPIIEQRIFDIAQKNLSEKLWYTRAQEEDYLLSWLIYCDSCKEERKRWMLKWTWVNSNRHKYYQCSWKNSQKHSHRCQVLPLWKDELEQVVIDFVREVINNPTVIAEYIRKTKWFKKHDESNKKRRRFLIDKINKLQDGYDRLRELYIESEMAFAEYKRRSSVLKKDIAERQSELQLIESKIQNDDDPRYYADMFHVVHELIGQNVEKTFKDPLATKRLLQVVISKIIIYSRPRKPWDIIAGKNASRAVKVPDRIHVVFNLPSELLNSLYAWLEILPKQPSPNIGNSKRGRKKTTFQRKSSWKTNKRTGVNNLNISMPSNIQQLIINYSNANHNLTFYEYVFEGVSPHKISVRDFFLLWKIIYLFGA